MRAHLTTAAGTALAVALLVSACGSSPAATQTSAPPAATATTEPVDEPVATPTETAAPAALTLTQAQIDTALLSQEDAPEIWVVDTTGTSPFADSTDPATASTYSTPECQTFFSLLEGDPAEKPSAKGDVAFSRTDDFGLLYEEIASWPTPLADGEFDAIVAALAACTQYTETTPDGTVTTNTLTPLDVPNLGDRTMAFRLVSNGSVNGQAMTLTLDGVFIATGQVSVAVMSGGLTAPDPADIADVAGAAMDKLASIV